MRNSTTIRYKSIIDEYNKIIRRLDTIAPYVSRSYIYELIQQETGCSTRTIDRAINQSKVIDNMTIYDDTDN